MLLLPLLQSCQLKSCVNPPILFSSAAISWHLSFLARQFSPFWFALDIHDYQWCFLRPILGAFVDSVSLSSDSSSFSWSLTFSSCSFCILIFWVDMVVRMDIVALANWVSASTIANPFAMNLACPIDLSIVLDSCMSWCTSAKMHLNSVQVWLAGWNFRNTLHSSLSTLALCTRLHVALTICLLVNDACLTLKNRWRLQYDRIALWSVD